jgi:hypothetical protein
MRSLSQDLISVRVQAYALLGITALWFADTFGFGFTPGIGGYWADLFCSFVPFGNLAFGLILWSSYRKEGWLHPWLVRLTLIVAISPFALFLWYFINPGF